ncbi:MAG: hypothetical protein SFU98_07525 [Leptospiraceae bacterium]|nr:hypothetical protein [Leptospiraceae bacterium]
MPVTKKVLKINKWTADIHNSNEKRVKKLFTKILPQYKNLVWNEEIFANFFIDIMNSLPARYKQKNSIELNGRLKESILEDAIREKLSELTHEIPKE